MITSSHSPDEINLFRRIARKIFPESFRRRVHYARHMDEYVHLRKADLAYGEDNLYTLNAAPFLEREEFRNAYALAEQTGSWHGGGIRWRVYVACWAGQLAANLPGDFVECGVNRGALARALVTYTNFARLKKRFFLVDTFTGLVPEYLNAAERESQLLERYAYYKDNAKEYVEKTFADVPNVEVIEGTVPDILPSIPAERVAFLSLDMNCTLPEIKAAEYFWERLAPGGIILLDDYAQKVHVEQQVAFDEFARARGVGVLSLPSGQGIILKPSRPDDASVGSGQTVV